MVPTVLQVFETKASFAFFCIKDWEKYYWKTMQYIKDRTECFDDYFPCKKKKCKLTHETMDKSVCRLSQ
jgi:hypothetical protein